MLPSSTTTSGVPDPGPWRYPETNFDADTDYVKIRFFDYTAPFSTQGGGTAGTSLSVYNQSSNGLGTAGATLYLYMPEDIEGQYGANWDAQNLSEVARGALGTFGSAAAGKAGETLVKAFDTFATPH